MANYLRLAGLIFVLTCSVSGCQSGGSSRAADPMSGSLGNTELKNDTWRTIQMFDMAADSSCQTRSVLSIKVTQPAVGGRWKERWTIDHCGRPVAYDVEYVPNSAGGTAILLPNVYKNF
jgi:hypothetical protein